MAIKVTYRYKKSGISMRILKNGDVSVSAPIGATKAQVLRFIEENRDWISQARQRMAVVHNRVEDFYSQLPLDTKQQQQEAVKKLIDIITPLINRYEREMGVSASKYSFSRAKGRWGSCNTRTGSIRFSIYMLLLPQWCIEHVVVHELAHLIVPNHSPRFYAVMDRFYPRWREARAEAKRLLRQYSVEE